MKRNGATAIVLVLMLAFCAHAGRGSTVSTHIVPGVRASFKHRVIIERETWPSALEETRAGRALLRLESMGGFRLHVRVRENPDDYVICVIYVDEGGRLILDESTRFVFLYDDREVESTEILLTDGPYEKAVFSSNEETIVLTSDSVRYAKAKSGGYLTAVRFPGNSLPAGSRWVPRSFELRGGDYDENVSG